MLDKDIREPLFDYLDARYGKVRVIEEKVIKRSRADVMAIVDGGIIGFEIKSDSDSYTRLKTQVKNYDQFFDKCYVVVGESHIHVAEHIPDYWGIIVVNQENVIVDRDAEICPKVKLRNQLDMLWRNELLNIQLKEGLPKLANWKRIDIYKRLIETAGEPTIKADVIEQLFERDYTIWDKPQNTLGIDGLKQESNKDITGKSTRKTTNKTRRKTTRKSNNKVVKKASKSAKKRSAHVTNYISAGTKKEKHIK